MYKRQAYSCSEKINIVFFLRNILYVIRHYRRLYVRSIKDVYKRQVVDSASRIAIDLGMSQTLVGLTIVSIGTSLPELVTSIVAARKNEVDMALGNAAVSYTHLDVYKRQDEVYRFELSIYHLQ